ncbi:dihydrolipoyl dehydrogenase family protein [Citricoccus muralis]|uniref:NAD(P)/FAD-dependent oxidoreductase n=1 Tax=Citricoccus muralis TaxID=169134 RepID=A0ABY8H767_9MICC|nr:NAD(P)/FAD-dependent oxidoreductase [Citricoccus muralis]WFP16503.1 NAD(P)/FAD-dependent oxidoreductase [Citricoccus muralis]
MPVSPDSPTQSQDESVADVIVLGGGPAGEVLAERVVRAGLSAAIVEHELLGGECSYYACIPSKALLRPLQVASTTAHLPGVEPTAPIPDALLRRRSDWVAHYDDAGQARWADKAGVKVLRGHARLVGERQIEIHQRSGAHHTVTAGRAVVIATGSTPRIPAVFEGVPVWDHRDATGAQEVPARLMIVGGGPVACEAATWMSALGAQVTLLVRGADVLGDAEPFVADLVTAGLEAAGVTIHTFTEVTSVRRPAGIDPGLGRVKGGAVTVRTSESELMEAEELLLATGRRPDLDRLNLESVDVDAAALARGDHSGLPDWLHVIGDAAGGPALTHLGKYQARQLAARLSGAKTTSDATPVPQVVFTEPQVASVGLTEAQARAAGHSTVTAEVDFTDVPGAALLRDDLTGRAKLVVDADTGLVLGATFVGPAAGELLHAATVAIVGKVPVGTLRHAVVAFPTASEVWLHLLEKLERV